MSSDEQTEGLGLGLNALFGEGEDNPIDELERQIQEELAAEDEAEAPNFAALMGEEDEFDEANYSEETEDALIEAAPEPEIEEEQSIEPIESSEAVDTVADEQTELSEPKKSKRNRQIVPIERLYPSKFQPRRIFSEDSINELASSIQQYGVLQPLLVREDPQNPDHFEIIAGERRWRASQKAQIHEMPVVILDLEELEAFKIALIENLQREDLDPIDEAMGYKKLLEEYDQTQEQLADAVGKSRPHITNMIRLLNLPSSVQAHLGAGDMSIGHARALLGAQNPEYLATQVVKKGLSVRQTENLVKNEKKDQTKTRTKPIAGTEKTSDQVPTKSADTIALENDISNALGMNVTINSADGKSGSLAIEFKSLDQLDEILHRLAHYPGARLNG